jgi:LacI family transcriptional regulator
MPRRNRAGSAPVYPPTAIFAATFYATLGAVKAINALDLAFPEEISLLRFEHSEWMMAIRPYVSAVRQSVDDLAAVSSRTLCNRIADESAELVWALLDFRREFRESTRPPAMVPKLASAGRP